MQSLHSKILALILVSFSLTSCTSEKIAFTPGIQNKHQFTELELKNIQFYTSEEIVLYNTKDYEHQSIQGGTIVFSDNGSSETVIIPKNTPCILEKVIDDGNMLVLSFEYGGIGKQLYFTNNNNVCYSLSAKEWTDVNGVMVGKLKYANKHYKTNAGNVFLTVKVKSIKHISNRERLIKGRTVF